MRLLRSMTAAVCFVVTIGSVATLVAQNGPAPAAVAAPKFDPKADPVKDLAGAVEQATKTHRRIILDVGGEWCGWCHALDKYFAERQELIALRDKHYVWLKINFSQDNENKAFLSKYPAVKGYPHLFVLEHDGTLLQSQDTSPLEEGPSYNLTRMTDFLKKWAPASPATAVRVLLW